MLKYLIIFSVISVCYIKCEFKNVECDFYKQLQEEEKYPCEPRNTTILVTDIIKEQYKNVPDAKLSKIKSYTIILPRCLGNCNDSAISCMPTKSETFRRKVNIPEVKETYNIDIIQHTACTCGCNVMASHCTSDQMYNKKLCACECNPAKKCEQNMELDPETCKCYCSMKPNACSEGYEFDEYNCSCEKKINNDIE